MTGSDRAPGRSGPAARVAAAWSLIRETASLWVGAVVAILGFLFAVQLLGAATEAAEPFVGHALRRVVVDDASALGLSWLVTYALANGSVVAALSLSLLRSGLVTASETFLMVAGSRLGGAAVVVLVGVLDYAGKRRRQTLSEGTSLGLLTFLVTLTIYLPATVLGVVLLPLLRSPLLAAGRGLELPGGTLQPLEPATAALTGALGPGPAFVLSILLLFGSLRLFDRVLGAVETESARTHLVRHLGRRWRAFGVGLVLTAATTSVAFSLGVAVPLYNRRFVGREEMVPYVLGANLGTLFDTLVVALVLETATGVGVVLLGLGLATLLTLAALTAYGPYAGAIDAGQERLLGDRRLLAGFGLALVAVPLTLLLVPLL